MQLSKFFAVYSYFFQLCIYIFKQNFGGVGKLSKIKKMLVEKLEIPYELLNDSIKLTVFGNVRMVVERHKGIEIYREEEIKIRGGAFCLRVKGEGMTIKNYGKDDIVIDGRLLSFEFEEA